MTHPARFAAAVLLGALAGYAAARLARPAIPAAPRIAPVDPASATPEQRRFLDSLEPNLARLNILRTFARNPRLASVWQPFAGYVLRGSTLPARDRELLILRIGWLNQSVYEFTQHVRVAKSAGLTDAEIERVKRGPAARGWTALERALLEAADQLHGNASLEERVWRELRGRYDDNQMMDVVVTLGQYNLVSWYLNALGVHLEDGVTPHPMK
jgi:alkylhydroperoxidase family enzyme